MSHDTINAHIQTNFRMLNDMKMSLDTIYNMLPWERIVYLGLYIKEIERKNKEARKGM